MYMYMLLEIRSNGEYIVNEYDVEGKQDVLQRITDELERQGVGHYTIEIARCQCRACQEGIGEHD